MEPTSPRERISLRDIARELNISHATVSRALREDRRISEAVREEVKRTAQAMGYRPDPMLSALAHYRRSKTKASIGAELAWINQWPNPKQLRSFQEFDRYWKGASEEAEQNGFRLEEFVINKRMSPARVQKILQARNIRGILIPPHGGVNLNWAEFHWENFCIVRFGHSIPAPRAHLVTSDQLTDGIIAFENIWNKGYRRIGLVTYARTHTRFSAGYLFSQMKWTPDLRIPMLTVAEEKNAEDQRRLKSWVKAQKLDAILTDLIPLRQWLKDAGYRVPGEIGLATLSVLDGNADAGIDQNSEEIGRAAVQLVISLINHNECGIPTVCRELLIEGRWVDGSTLPTRAIQMS